MYKKPVTSLGDRLCLRRSDDIETANAGSGYLIQIGLRIHFICISIGFQSRVFITYTCIFNGEVEISNVYGYQGNRRNFLRTTSAISAITRFLPVLIMCGAAFTRNHKRVAFKIKTSLMMKENMLINHYV